MTKKICCCCKNEKELDEFPFRNKEKNIRHGICKECWKDVRKESYEKNKKTTLVRNKRNKRRNVEWYNEYKSKLKCVKCDENHPACLEFHHDDPNEKEYNVSELIRTTYSIKKIIKEIEKCTIFCSNCHKKYHYNLTNKLKL